MNVSCLSLASNNISMGALLGTTGSSELLRNINAASGGTTYFGSANDPHRGIHQTFMQMVVNPLRTASAAIANVQAKLERKDTMRAINSIEELERGIPPTMHLPIVYYPPIRKMLEDERIDGFGIDPKQLDVEDIYADILKSGYIEFSSEDLDKDGGITMAHIFNSDDQELELEEIEFIRATREYIDEFMNDEDTSFMDFTDYPSLHA